MEMESKKHEEQQIQHYIDEFELSDGDSSSEDINRWLIKAKELVFDRQRQESLARRVANREAIINDDERCSLEPYTHYEFEDISSCHARLDPIEIVKFASECKNVNFDIPNDFGRPPFHYAACIGALVARLY